MVEPRLSFKNDVTAPVSHANRMAGRGPYQNCIRLTSSAPLGENTRAALETLGKLME